MWQHSHVTLKPSIHAIVAQKHHVFDDHFLFWLDLRLSATVEKWVDEAESRLPIAIQSFSRLTGVWKGCGNTLVALCSFLSMPSWPQMLFAFYL